MRIKEFFKKLYFWSSGYSYTNLGRLFLRHFVGLMLMQFGVRQIIEFEAESGMFPSVLGMSPETACVVMICIEIGCSFFIMCGFLTRIMIVPPFISMILAEYHILHTMAHQEPYMLQWTQPGYVPIMFLGIYFFLLLVGPGKISIDYFLSLHIIHTDNKSERELEEV